MTLNETVLQKVAEWRLPGDKRQTLSIPNEGSGWAVEIQAERNDELGCRVWELGLRHMDRTRTTKDDTLQAWADQAAARVTSLVESLKVVEVDKVRNEALLRSSKPSGRGKTVSYFEVLLRGTSEACVRRYRGHHESGRRREQIPFPLTHEALAQVVADLATKD
jgi:hypothetical protein